MPFTGQQTTDGTPTWGSRNLKSFFVARYLKNLVGMEVLGKYALPADIPANLSKTIEWTKVARRTKVAAATEGEAPSASKPATTIIQGTIAEYADYMTFSGLFQITTFEKLKEFVDSYKQGMIETREWNYMYECCTGNGLSLYANAKTALGDLEAGDYARVRDISKMRKALVQQKAERFSNGYFKVFPNASIFDLWASADGATNVIAASYQGENGEPIRQWRMFHYAGMEIEEISLDQYYVNGSNVNGTPAVGEVGVTANIIRIPFCGKDTFAGIKINAKGRSPYSGGPNNDIIIKDPTEGGAAIPTNEYGSIGYRFVHAAKVIQPNALGNYIVPDLDYVSA